VLDYGAREINFAYCHNKAMLRYSIPQPTEYERDTASLYDFAKSPDSLQTAERASSGGCNPQVIDIVRSYAVLQLTFSQHSIKELRFQFEPRQTDLARKRDAGEQDGGTVAD
jgi:hypothetical protein